jgi:hypothetical protein
MANPYYGQSLAWLTTELEKWKAAHSALSTGEDYEVSVNGVTRRLTRFKDLRLVQDAMFQIKSEIDRQGGTARPRVSYPIFLE